MTIVYLGLGSNIGDKEKHLKDALEQLVTLGTIRKQSRVFSTEPIGFRDQDWFLNCAIELDTTIGPETLLTSLQAIERKLGRKKTEKNMPRIIDIDILFYGDEIINTKILTVPHPRIQDRLFVLQPLMDLNPGFRHPVLKKTVQELYTNHPWTDKVIPRTDEIKTSKQRSVLPARSSHMRLCQEFIFDAAHYIPHYKGKCEQLHGHTYRLEVIITEESNTSPKITFDTIKEIVKELIIEKLDHQSLNNFFENPTAEIILEWIATQLKEKLPLAALRLWEGQGKWVEIRF
jgi:2-amino-4-hydroxy-6-hydroxymethyldihydropteridine diphosphokinase